MNESLQDPLRQNFGPTCFGKTQADKGGHRNTFSLSLASVQATELITPNGQHSHQDGNGEIRRIKKEFRNIRG